MSPLVTCICVPFLSYTFDSQTLFSFTRPDYHHLWQIGDVLVGLLSTADIQKVS